MASNAFNWFYDWAAIAKNDAYYTVEVRQYNSQSIPASIPWKPYDPSTPIPFLTPPTGSTPYAHWSFAVTHPTASVYDLSGNQGTLTNSKATIENNVLLVSRRHPYTVLGGGSTGYNLASATTAHGLAIPDTSSFTWETYIYGMDATASATSLSFIHTGSAGQGYAIQFDFTGNTLRFTVGSASVTGVVTCSIANLRAESGFPANYHYVAGSLLHGYGLFLYIDGVLQSSVAYTGSVQSGSVAFKVRHGETMFVDEFSMWSGYLNENDALARYTMTKERLRYLGMPSGSYQPYHQARFTTYASGSSEFELHSFSIRGLQNTSASIFDPRKTDLYALPIFTSVSGSSGQSIGGIVLN